MKMRAPGDCFVCQKHLGRIIAPGGSIYEDDLIFVSHASLWGNETDHYLGHVFIEPKRHVAELGDLNGAEAQAIGLFTSRVARALMHIAGVEHVYSFVIGDGVPHVHAQVIGRYPGAPREYWGQGLMNGRRLLEALRRRSRFWLLAYADFFKRTMTMKSMNRTRPDW